MQMATNGTKSDGVKAHPATPTQPRRRTAMRPRTKTMTTQRDRLAELDAAIRGAEQRLDSTHKQAHEALGGLEDLRVRESAAWANDDHAEAEKIAQERIRIESTKVSWQTRLQAADRAVETAKMARRSFVVDSGDELVEEHVEGAEQVTADFLAAVEQVRERLGAFVRLEQTLRGYVDPSRHRPEDPRLVELAKLTEQLLDPEFQTTYSLRPIGLPNPLPLPAVVEEPEQPETQAAA